MLPASYPLALYRGDSGAWVFRCWVDADKTEPADLTDVTARASIRTAGTTIALTCVVTLPNEIAMTLAADAWSGAEAATGAWDLELTYPTGAVRTLLRGAVSIVADVTGALYERSSHAAVC